MKNILSTPKRTINWSDEKYQLKQQELYANEDEDVSESSVDSQSSDASDIEEDSKSSPIPITEDSNFQFPTTNITIPCYLESKYEKSHALEILEFYGEEISEWLFHVDFIPLNWWSSRRYIYKKMFYLVRGYCHLFGKDQWYLGDMNCFLYNEKTQLWQIGVFLDIGKMAIAKLSNCIQKNHSEMSLEISQHISDHFTGMNEVMISSEFWNMHKINLWEHSQDVMTIDPEKIEEQQMMKLQQMNRRYSTRLKKNKLPISDLNVAFNIAKSLKEGEERSGSTTPLKKSMSSFALSNLKRRTSSFGAKVQTGLKKAPSFHSISKNELGIN